MLWLLSGPLGFTCWISFAPVFSFTYCWVLIFALSPFYILIISFRRWSIDKLGSFMQTKHLCVLVQIELRVNLAPRETGLSPPVKYFTDHSKALLIFGSFMLFPSCFCYAFVCVCYWCLVVTCWRRVDLLALVCDVVMSCCEVVTFPLVSWVRCGAWLYRFLIFALFRTMRIRCVSKSHALAYIRSAISAQVIMCTF